MTSRKLPQRVHRQYLLKEAEHFKDHKKGIPEWLKNSDDSYIRLEEKEKINYSNIPIIINFSKKEISCVDFGGATSEDMIEHIPYYGSPEASTLGGSVGHKKVSGGHGNGGKYYALSQFKEVKIISFFKGKLTILRLDKEGDYVELEDDPATSWQAIREVGIDKWGYFEEIAPIIERLNKGELGLFCWKGIGPKEKKQIINKRILSRVISSICNHPQSRSALRTRRVDALYEGNVFWPSMKPEEVEVDESFGYREFSLPNKIEGYEFNKHFNSTLKIVLSKTTLNGEKSSLNILEIDSFNRNIAYYNIPALMLDKGLSKSLAAHIDCPELKEYNCVSNDRVNLIENEVTNLFLNWCKSKIKEVLEELTNKEKKKQEKKNLDELGGFLQDLVDEVSDLLEEDNLLKPVFNKEGSDKAKVDVPTEKPGFGGEGKIGKTGGGKRKGGTENKEGSTEHKKSKSKLKILLSNHDEDPLNPGHLYEMIERQPVLFQRVEDVDYGIWWINSQKRYIRKIKIKDPGAMPFYFFLVKEIVLSHRTRRRFKEQERFDPDGLEELNFDLIDDIFNKTAERLGIELSVDESVAEKIRNSIKDRKKFTAAEIADDTGASVMAVHAFIGNSSNHVYDNFDLKKEVNKKGRTINTYIKK